MRKDSGRQGSIIQPTLLAAALVLLLTGCAGAPVSGYGKNMLAVVNGTGDAALVRIKTDAGATVAELSIDPGRSERCRLPDGHFREVVRFGRPPGPFRYARGQGFDLSAPAGAYVQGTLTLHGVQYGNYATFPATAADFE